MKKTNIKAVIFDLGGVLIDIDYQKTIDAFIALGVENASDLYNQFDQKMLFDEYEKGEVSGDYFISQIEPLTNPGVEKNKIIKAWNALIGEFPQEKLAFIDKIQSKIPCYLLSNTNDIHLKKVYANSNSDFESLFRKCYYSHLIGKRKPDTATFQWVVEQIQLKASEILFIDDSPQHIKGAKDIGLQTIHYKNKEDLFSIENRIRINELDE